MIRAFNIMVMLLLMLTAMHCFWWIAYADEASAPPEIIVERVEVLEDMLFNKEHGFMVYQTEGGEFVYPLDLNTRGSKTGDALQLLNEYDPGVQCILENGYPTKELTGNREIDICITQAALFWYYNREGSSVNEIAHYAESDGYGLVDDYIRPLVEFASAEAERYVGRDRQYVLVDRAFVNAPDPKMIMDMGLTDDGGWYESDPIKISVRWSEDYSVSVIAQIEGAQVVDLYGYPRSVFPSGSEFKLRIPTSSVKGSEELKVKVEYAGNVPVSETYRTIGDDSFERMAMLCDEDYLFEIELTFRASSDLFSIYSPIWAIAVTIVVVSCAAAVAAVLVWAARNGRKS